MGDAGSHYGALTLPTIISVHMCISNLSNDHPQGRPRAWPSAATHIHVLLRRFQAMQPWSLLPLCSKQCVNPDTLYNSPGAALISTKHTVHATLYESSLHVKWCTIGTSAFFHAWWNAFIRQIYLKDHFFPVQGVQDVGYVGPGSSATSCCSFNH